MVKTHKTTIFFPAEREDKFEDIKKRVLSALTQFNAEQDVPPVTSTDEFELCVSRKTPGKGFTFEIIDPDKRVNEVYMSKPWDYAYIKFRNPETREYAFDRVGEEG
jgi:hypothetical protein